MHIEFFEFAKPYGTLTGYYGNIVWDLKHFAEKSTCHRSRCAAVIINGHTVLGHGYNSMPCNAVGPCVKDELHPTFKSDKTCCLHAEQRAIIDAYKKHSEGADHFFKESTIYFLRLDEKNEPMVAGDPYRSICSKMALDAGIKNFALYDKLGWRIYTTKEYNEITFKYKNDMKKTEPNLQVTADGITFNQAAHALANRFVLKSVFDMSNEELKQERERAKKCALIHIDEAMKIVGNFTLKEQNRFIDHLELLKNELEKL